MITRDPFAAVAVAWAALLSLPFGLASAQAHGAAGSQGRITSIAARRTDVRTVELNVLGSGTCDLLFKGTFNGQAAKEKLPASVRVDAAAGTNAVVVYSPNCAGVASTSFVDQGELESLTAHPVEKMMKEGGGWPLGKRVRVIASGDHGCRDFVLYESSGKMVRALARPAAVGGKGGVLLPASDTVDITPAVAGEDTLILFPGVTCGGTPVSVVGHVRGEADDVAIGSLTPSTRQSRPGAPVLFTIHGPAGAHCEGAVVAFGDGESVSLQAFAFDITVSHTYRMPGTFTARAAPAGREGASCGGSATTTVDVQAPRLETVSAPNETVVGRTVAVQLNGTPATCSDIEVGFGDGTSTHVTALPARVDHTYRAAGTHEITAAARGNCAGAARVSIVVDAREAEKPTTLHAAKP